MTEIKKTTPRVMLAGVNSGCGKTAVTCAVLKALLKKKLKVTSFKCGPDYIDPMFHKTVLQIDTGNLDLFMTGENTVKYLLAKNSGESDISVIEGVMGLYDGLGNSSYASSNHLSMVTNTPVILVVDGKGMSLSILALIKGYMDFMPNNIKGVIINRISEKTYMALKEMIEEQLGINVLGFLDKQPGASIPDRHLGLVTAGEVPGLNEKLELLGARALETIDIHLLIKIAEKAEQVKYSDISFNKLKKPLKIGVARDNAFCFYYDDNLSLLKQMGAEIEFFSPLTDKETPDNISGLMIGGGYPELYLKQLSGNESMKKNIGRLLASGMPCIAECGGYMYLTESLDGFPMVGFINAKCHSTKKLSSFGYVNLEAVNDNMLCLRGDVLKCHEFHYSDCDTPGTGFISKNGSCGHATGGLYAAYPHINFWSDTSIAWRFLKKCEEWSIYNEK